MEDDTQTLTTPGSSPSEVPGSLDAAQDAKETAGSSPAEGAVPKTLAEAIARAADARQGEDQGKADESPESETGSQDGEPEGKVEDEPKPTEKPDANVPFHKHPRWIEKVQETRTLTRQVEDLKTQTQVLDELKAATGGDQGFETLRTLATAYAHDPARAVDILEQLTKDAKVRAGKVLADDDTTQDLRQKVEDGLIDEQSALEIQEARLLKKQNEQHRVDTFRQGMVTALNSWEKNIAERNPDYAAMSADVAKEMTYLASRNYPQNANDAVALANQAFAFVKSRYAGVTPKPAQSRPLRSTGSSATVRPAPKSLREVVANAMRGN